MFLQEILDWLVAPAGGGQFLAIALASWLVEARKFWTVSLSSKWRSGIVGIASAVAVVLAVLSGEGNIDSLFADAEASLTTALNVGAVWIVSQIAHALNPRR